MNPLMNAGSQQDAFQKQLFAQNNQNGSSRQQRLSDEQSQMNQQRQQPQQIQGYQSQQQAPQQQQNNQRFNIQEVQNNQQLSAYDRVFQLQPDGTRLANYEDIRKYQQSEQRKEIPVTGKTGVKKIVEISHNM